MRRLRASLLLFLSIPAQAGDAASPLWAQAEAASAWQTRNEAQSPAGTGTRFSLVSLGQGPVAAFRVYVGYRLADRHELRALFAPLVIELTGRLQAPVSYQGQLFGTQQDTTAYYRFNSYRLTYSYGLLREDRFALDAGFTAKIRDAEIRLTQGGVTATRANVGFVPLLHLRAAYAPADRVSIALDVDALVSPYGRAEDMALLGAYRLSDGWEILGGYRTVEGGSDGRGGIYTFAWVHFATLGARYGF